MSSHTCEVTHNAEESIHAGSARRRKKSQRARHLRAVRVGCSLNQAEVGRAGQSRRGNMTAVAAPLENSVATRLPPYYLYLYLL